MAAIDLTNPLTGVNLSKEIRRITSLIIIAESERLAMIKPAIIYSLIEDRVYNEISNNIDGLLIKRNKLIERLIGYCASDNYGLNYRINSDRNILPSKVPYHPRRNIKECIKTYQDYNFKSNVSKCKI